jgi:hypothetical protein
MEILSAGAIVNHTRWPTRGGHPGARNKRPLDNQRDQPKGWYQLESCRRGVAQSSGGCGVVKTHSHFSEPDIYPQPVRNFIDRPEEQIRNFIV